MNQLVSRGIILSRTNYGEADRIITLLTPDYGKLSLIAKGVRKARSKLAGGIELFSISQISFIRGRGEVGTLVSARLERHYGKISQNLERTMLGYELTKQLNKATQDQTEPAYFDLLAASFAALDDHAIDLALIRLWFLAQLISLAGQAPNLASAGLASASSSSSSTYAFDMDSMSFKPSASGEFSARHVKFLKLVFSGNQPKLLARVEGSDSYASQCLALVQTLYQQL